MALRYNGRREDLRSYGALQCERLVLLSIGDQKELYVTLPRSSSSSGSNNNNSAADDIIVVEGGGGGGEYGDEMPPQPLVANVYNRLGQLLLPSCVPRQDLEDLERRMNDEALVMWDSLGRVHQIVLDECIFMTWMQLWAPPRYTKATVYLRSVSHDEARLYAAAPFHQTLFRLPEWSPPEFRQWTPEPGDRVIEYDQLGRVFSIYGGGDSIVLSALWEPRLWPVQAEVRDKK